MSDKMCERDLLQLRCMMHGSEELAQCFDGFSKQTSSPLVMDEFQKLSAAALNQKSQILKLLGDENE
ncbi:MAG: hypothetical protein LUI06_06250 [Ruminococcus sp.]|nr:hypothetical protein [Ruminococcus sp.]